MKWLQCFTKPTAHRVCPKQLEHLSFLSFKLLKRKLIVSTSEAKGERHVVDGRIMCEYRVVTKVTNKKPVDTGTHSAEFRRIVNGEYEDIVEKGPDEVDWREFPSFKAAVEKVTSVKRAAEMKLRKS